MWASHRRCGPWRSARSSARPKVARPDLREVIADERPPELPAPTVEIARPIFSDGARRHYPAELAALGRDDRLSPGRVFAPQPPDERTQVRRDRRTTRRAF